MQLVVEALHAVWLSTTYTGILLGFSKYTLFASALPVAGDWSAKLGTALRSLAGY